MIIFGKQSVLYALANHKESVEKILLAKEIDKKLFSEVAKSGKKIERVDNKKAQALAHGGNHQGLLAIISPLSLRDPKELLKGDFVLITVGVTDTGNIGSIVRTAWALGVSGVVFSGVNQLNLEAIIRTSSGAALDMPLSLIANSSEAVELFKQAGFVICGATLDGDEPKGLELAGKKRVLVLGSEGEGLPARIEKKLDRKLTIKMSHGFDSINVSAATAILIDRMR